ncbi:MAG: type II toxin-antitoxin system YafQ family toxin [Rhabdochlamydiaceae bacterium]|jgi:mRNA interferase YafQ
MIKYQHNRLVHNELDAVINFLRIRKKLPEKYKDHALVGDYVGMRECHIKPDILLIYWIDETGQNLYLERLGSHSKLF